VPSTISTVVSVDSFRPEIQTFLDSVFLTDACMIYAAVIHAASRQKQNLDSYVTKILFEEACVRNIFCLPQ
jgi:hypothetical protein